ncbi:MAG TPA: hypothetical protein VGC79_36650 [Polyangiaceae bacterium]
MQEIWPDVILPLSNHGDRDGFLAVGASPDEVLWLTAPQPLPDGATFAKKTVMQLHSYRSGPEATTRPYAHWRRPHFVQRAKGGFMFVAARAPDDEANAWWADDALKSERPLLLGDGIADVRVAPSGKIWTAYFDEGVFGGGLGTGGLLEFDASGRKRWAHDAEKAGTDEIADVYALNLAAEDDVWLYFYTPFSIVRWLRKRPTVWQTRVQGARAIATQQNQALLFGDYEDPLAIRILDLPSSGGVARVKRRLLLRLPPGTELESIQAYGAGQRLVLCSSSQLMIIERW